MLLLDTTDTLRIALGSDPTAEAPLVAAYLDVADDASSAEPGRVSSITNATTAVDWVSAPSTGKRQIKFLSIFNADAGSITATISLHDGTNTRSIFKVTLATGEQAHYTDGIGFKVLSADGSTKSAALVVDGDKGDISVSGGVWSIDAGVVTLAKMAALAKTQPFIVPASDETTALTTGTAKVTFRFPAAWTLTGVRASLTTAQATSGGGGILTVDINKNGSTILSTKITIDNTEKTSVSASTQPVLSSSSIADDDEITIDIDQIGDGSAKGLKVTFLGYPT